VKARLAVQKLRDSGLAPAASESVADAVAVVRVAVLEHRGQLAEQLALFG